MKLFSLHYRGLVLAITKIIRQPIEHLLNILVLSLIIAVVASIMVISKSSNDWQERNINHPQIMIYMESSVSPADIAKLEVSISKNNTKIIRGYQFISKEQGLAELQQDAQLKDIASDVVSANNANPLPDVLIVDTNLTDSTQIQQLRDKIARMPNVATVDMDINYANKVSDLVSFIKQISIFLQILFVVVLALVVYNMVRLQMLLRQSEITVSRLIGATDSFIMRPLAYYAVTQMVIAAGVACILVNCFIHYLNNLFLGLNNLFGATFLLNKLCAVQIIELIAILVIFTIFAVFLAMKWVFRNSNTL